MKILAVCGFGVGSSLVLRMTVEKVVKELGIDAEVENTDLSTAKATLADVYFTSFELQQELEKTIKAPIYPIKKYMDVNEVREQFKRYLASKGE
ncbi:PTS sugar transporter subunit IIB [uncultured Abiotrophia sp.]|uniref:PTS sugar transporter subunit IIB n=1 Tax=uncultured Abiotrophia sp. TaxID=316094 RepID=UPI00261A1AE6|nr:PTS sugar transporter subunit IIB [uncultured Abiotrophia sp.]